MSRTNTYTTILLVCGRVADMNRGPRNLLILVVVVIVAALFLWNKGGTSNPIATAQLQCPNCNVIIIGVDTLRADHVHAFGYPLETTPNIDALASKGYSFTDAISASNWTVPSFMSIMTGVYPSVHKVVNKYVEYDPKDPKKQILSNLGQLSPQIQTLAQAMKGAGYATGGFTGDAGVSGSFGYKQGFDVYTDEKTFGGLQNSEGHALTWLDSLGKGQKFFMFFHGYDLHGQFNLATSSRVFVPQNYKGSYTGSPAEEAKLREAQLAGPISLTTADAAFWTGLYDSKIHEADAQVGDFIAQLKTRGLLGNTIIVVVADHGEEFYEHGGIDHGQSLYDELVHVPLIIDVPNAAGGKMIPAQISTMDVGPTLFGILGISADKTFADQQLGKNLLPYMAGQESTGRDVFIETDYRDFTHQRAVRTADGWKYIITLESGKEQLYDLNTDPAEKNNLITANAQKASTLKQELEAHVKTDLGSTLAAPASTGCLPVYKGECQ